jgi:hypothetical protein
MKRKGGKEGRSRSAGESRDGTHEKLKRREASTRDSHRDQTGWSGLEYGTFARDPSS